MQKEKIKNKRIRTSKNYVTIPKKCKCNCNTRRKMKRIKLKYLKLFEMAESFSKLIT